MMNRSILALAALAASALALSGCAASSAANADGKVQVVATTNVYGSIASQIGGKEVDVHSLISSPTQDPHEFEPSAGDQLLVKRAGLLIENGGGYDPFLDSLAKSAGADAPLITAAKLSPAYPKDGSLEGFNEHVFYDPETMAKTADEIAAQLGKLDAQHAAQFTANAKSFGDEMAAIGKTLTGISSAHKGEGVFVTEPLPLYLTAAAGLANKTPPAFSKAVEEGQDVPPATLLEATALIGSGAVKVVIVNAQAAGAETTQVEQKAAAAGIPVLKFSELVLDGKTYPQWMQGNADALAKALG